MAKTNYSIMVGLNAAGIKKGVADAKNAINGFASSVKSAFGMIAGAFAAGQIKAFSKECLDAYSAQMQAETKLSTIMKQRMNASDAEVKSILQLTSAQQKLGVIGDEVQIAGAQQVATFLKSKQSLDTLIPAMNNLLAQQKGLSATQGDAVTIGNLMGKVMQGQTSALKRVGITFDENQEKLLKYGTEEQRAATLAQVITDNVGNMNSELAQTDMGKIQQMNNILGDLKEKIGAAIAPIVSQLAPSITEFATSGANAIVSFIDVVKSNFATIAEFIVGVFAAVKLTPMIQQWLASFSAAQDAAAAKVAATAARREAIEEALTKKKQTLAVLEAQYEEASGSKKVSIANKIAAQKAAIAKKETALQKAQDAEQVAAAEASAIEQQTIFGAAFAGIRTAAVACWTAVKGVMVSTGIGALVMAIVFAVQKLWEKFGEGSEVMSKLKTWAKGAFQSIIKGVEDVCNYFVDLYNDSLVVRLGVQAIVTSFKNLWSTAKLVVKLIMNAFRLLGDELSGLGELLDGVFTLDWSKITGGATKMFNSYGKMLKNSAKDVKAYGKEMGQNLVKGIQTAVKGGKLSKVSFSAAAAVTGGGTGGTGGTGGGGGSTGGTTATAKAKKAAKEELTDYQKLIEEYIKKKHDLDAALKVGNITQEEYNEQLQQAKNTLQQNLETVKAANDEEKANIETWKEQLALTRDVTEEIEKQKEKQELQKKVAEAGKGSRDTTFDYNRSKGETVRADLEFNLDKAKKQLSILQDDANKDIEGIKNMIDEQMSQVTSLEDALKLNQLKTDIQSLKKDLNMAVEESVTESWEGLKNVVSDVQDVYETFKDPDASGWEKFVSVIDAAIGIFQTVKGVIEAINTVRQISTTLAGAQTAAETANATATAATATAQAAAAPAAIAMGASAKVAAEGLETMAAAQMFAAHAAIPVVGAALGATSVGVMEGVLASVKAAAKFSTGGLVEGATSHGDFIPAMLNQNEMVLNPNEQNRLFRLATGQNTASGLTSGSVEFKIAGRELRGVLKNDNTRNSKLM